MLCVTYPGRRLSSPYTDTSNLLRHNVIIRPYEREDEKRCKLLLADDLWSFGGTVFRHIILRKINLLLMFVCAAIMFIFFKIPLYLCILAICTVVVFIYCSMYINIAYKAVLINREDFYSVYMTDQVSCFWVMEIQSKKKDSCVSSEKNRREQKKTNDAPYRNRTIVGTIAVTKNLTLNRGAWIKRLCLHKKFENKYMREALIETAMFFAYEQCYSSISIQVPMYRKSVEITCNRIGFKLRQTFHKNIVALFLRILMHEFIYEFIYEYGELQKTKPRYSHVNKSLTRYQIDSDNKCLVQI